MLFQHSGEIWQDFPELVPGLLFAEGITPDASVSAPVARFTDQARSWLAQGPEGELAEVQAWRRVFARMGLKPTQYRCAAESLLRRLRTQGSLPRLHPLVDLCNAISVAFAIPVAVFDVSKVAGDLEVRYAAGNEEYLTFAGEVERPAAHEVIFADRAGRAHARRWTNRQSGLSAVQSSTSAALIVAEAMHGTASSDMRRLTEAIADELAATWPTKPTVAILSQRSSSFTFDPKRAGPWLTRAGAGDEHP